MKNNSVEIVLKNRGCKKLVTQITKIPHKLIIKSLEVFTSTKKKNSQQQTSLEGQIEGVSSKKCMNV